MSLPPHDAHINSLYGKSIVHVIVSCNHVDVEVLSCYIVYNHMNMYTQHNLLTLYKK